jgi:signal transduction histidine kinase
MLRKPVHSSIFIFLLFIGWFLFSCQSDGSPVNPVFNAAADRGEFFLQQQDYKNAFKYYLVAKNACSTAEANRHLYTCGKLAEIYRINGDFLESEAIATEAFAFFDQSDKPEYKVFIYNCLGINYQEKEDYKNALLYYDKAFRIAASEVDRLSILNNIAVVYLESNDYARAKATLVPLLSNTTIVHYPLVRATVLDNLGFALFKLKSPASLEYLNQGLALREAANHGFGSISSYIHLANYYLALDPGLASAYASKGYAAALQVGNPDDQLEALDLLIKTSTGSALKTYYAQYHALATKTQKNRQSNRNEFAKIKYDSKKVILERERYQQMALWIPILVFIAAFIGIMLVRYRNRQKIRRTIYKTETRIAKQLHDELANDVYQAMAFAETQNLDEPEKKEVLLESLDHIYTRTRNISQQNSEIPTDASFKAALLDLLNSFTSTAVTVVVTSSDGIDWLMAKKDVKITIYRVLQELLVNMKKHSQCSLVVVSFATKGKVLEITYSDNGTGFATAGVLKKGLQNVENRIHDLKGTVTFGSETGKGFRVTFNLPK